MGLAHNQRIFVLCNRLLLRIQDGLSTIRDHICDPPEGEFLPTSTATCTGRWRSKAGGLVRATASRSTGRPIGVDRNSSPGRRSGNERPESGRVSDAGPGASDRPGTRGRRRKASDEGTRGKAASSWRAMGIWCGSGFGGGWSSQDRWIPTGAEDCGLGAAALDGLSENSSVVSFVRLQGPGRNERAAGNEMFRRMNAARTR
jgi:hypothetical protein